MREYQREWMRKRRESFFEGKSCAICGSSEKLELDHIDRSTKLISPTGLWSLSDSNPKKIAELAKCQVLCSECHLEKTISEKKDILGSETSQAKLDESSVRDIKRRLHSGSRQSDLASEYGVRKQTINDIAKGRTWSHI